MVMDFRTRKRDGQAFPVRQKGTVRSNVQPNITGSQTGFRERQMKAGEERQEQFKPENIKTVADVMALNQERGQFFFSPDTIKFFGSRILGGDLLGRKKDLFITSEKRPPMENETTFRKFTIRKVNKKSGSIDTVGEFQQFGTQQQARNFIKESNL